MAEKINNFITDEAMDNGEPQPLAAPNENELINGDVTDKKHECCSSESEEFIKRERESFNSRYTEIMQLVGKVGSIGKTSDHDSAENLSSGSIILSITADKSDKGEKNRENSKKSSITVPINTVHCVTAPSDLKELIFDTHSDSKSNELGRDFSYGDFQNLNEGNSNGSDEYAFSLKSDTNLPDERNPSLYGSGEEFSDSDKERDAFDEHNHGYKYDSLDIFARAELSKGINSFYRRQSALLRQISKLEDRQKNADSEGNISLIVEKIAVLKELCELTIEILGSCVYLEARGKGARFKRILKTNIDKYNALCDEYEGASGRAVEHLDYGIIDDVMAGKISRPISNVYYYGSEDDAVYDRHDEEYDRMRRIEEEEEAASREYKRYLDGGTQLNLSDSERIALAKRKNEKLSAIKRATERDVLLAELRSEYALSELEARRDILVRSYGLDKRKMVKSLRTVERKIEKINRNTQKAIKIERENNSRYYLLCMLDPADEKLKNGARRERLDALRARLNVLLSERESVNDRLIALYGGSDRTLKRTKVSRKAAKIRRRSATAMYNAQRKLAKKIDKYRVPTDMKERAYDLLNKKTQAAATADECIYKLKKLRPVGRAKRELILEIKRARTTIRRLDREIRYMLRKLKRNQERYEDNKEWASVLAFVFVIVAIGVVLWVLFGQNVTEYFAKLAGQLGGA